MEEFKYLIPEESNDATRMDASLMRTIEGHLRKTFNAHDYQELLLPTFEYADYINCPMNKAEYEEFYQALIGAERAPLHDCDKDAFRVYEGCMPIEVLASRGMDTMRSVSSGHDGVL